MLTKSIPPNERRIPLMQSMSYILQMLIFNLYYFVLDSLDSGLDGTKEIETKDRRKKDKPINVYVQ